ncbi:membrane protein [Lysinibacillus alkalisoli]|uniref:Membrane protein n=1 Tax=Lysinibacillus alkalisoli TaxID=1911548 RepID=A0A917FXP2_9BACI|nr:QueT transporter family protein [Lysinibacillus alkalisoli]GGG11706.1 membrane protein [Lysinibacillus alkalisoli]
MKTKVLAINGVIAALYVALAFAIKPFAFGELQFRLPEIFNHLVAFNPLFLPGIVIGVFVANLSSPLGWYDLVFGVGHSLLTLSIAIVLFKFIKNTWAKLITMTLLFSFTMFIIAFELHLALDLPFWWTWLYTAISELIVLSIGMPIIYALNKRINFKDVFK